MAYSALYRRLRPKTFGEVVGQEHIIKTLRNQVITGRVSHAYLFCGTRGTGKTTTALLFARAVNCLSPKDGEPCGECEACAAVSRGGSFNVIEIDAASNNGVESIRDIREEVKYPPAEGKTKTYIIDEAHMLSPSAFNALLKTLEEPPAGVIFILATTDPQKIPQTVHSRCQRFDFKRLSLAEMAGALERYLIQEGIAFDSEAVRLAARIADGSMRDALSILDQCASFYGGEKISLELVMEVTGSVDTRVLSKLVKAIADGKAAEGLIIIDEIINGGRDAHQAVSELLAHVRNLLIAVTSGGQAGKLLDFSGEILEELKETASGLSVNMLLRYVSVFSELVSKMRYAGNPRILFEAACIELTNPADRNAEIKPVLELDLKIQGTQRTTKKIDAKEGSVVNQENTSGIKPENKSESGKSAIENWGAFLASLGAADRSLLMGCKPALGENGVINIICGNKGIYDILKTKREAIGAGVRERFGAAGAEIILDSDYKAKEMERLTSMINMDIDMV